jgi:hypothetical protein
MHKSSKRTLPFRITCINFIVAYYTAFISLMYSTHPPISFSFIRPFYERMVESVTGLITESLQIQAPVHLASLG